MFKVYYPMTVVYEDARYYPIQNRLIELLNRYNWKFNAQEKKSLLRN